MEEQNQEGGDKISKRYDDNIKKLLALFNGDSAFKKEKINNSEVGKIIEELTKEKKENLIKEFKEKASKLLTSKVEFDKFVNQKNKELEQAISNKKKEFNKEMEDCFQIIDNIDKLKSEYEKSFKELNNNGNQ